MKTTPRSMTISAPLVLVDQKHRVLEQPSHHWVSVGQLHFEPELEGGLQGPDLVLDSLDRPLGSAVGLRLPRMIMFRDSHMR